MTSPYPDYAEPLILARQALAAAEQAILRRDYQAAGALVESGQRCLQALADAVEGMALANVEGTR